MNIFFGTRNSREKVTASENNEINYKTLIAAPLLGMLEYQPLNISEFVCGYVEMVKLYPQIPEVLYAHLQLLIGKAMTYSWNYVKTFHLDGTCDFFVGERSHVVETTKCNHWKGQ